MVDIANALAAYAIGNEERKILRNLTPMMVEGMDDVLDAFYAYALGNGEIADFFGSKSVVAHARGRQKEHWMMLLNGEFGQEYLDSARIIGQVHFKIQLPFQFYMSAYARAGSDLTKLVASKTMKRASLGGQGRAVEVLQVLSRAMFLDAQLVIQAFFDAQSAEQTTALDAVTDGLSAIASGSHASRIASAEEGGSFPARFDTLRQSFNGAVESLQAVNEQFLPMVSNMGLSTEEVTSAVSELAGRTEQQGHTLASTVASVRSLSDSVKNSASNANEVDQEARNASDDAKRTGEVVQQAVEAMKAIEGSSKTIAERINSINEIAFQTNLLALNAAVEAARAGDAGRGFAIVANEVRQLAERASQTAKEIEQIIQDSERHVASGVERVGETGNALERIIGNVIKVGSLITEVSENAQSQASQLQDIRTSLDQLDEVTQANVAMVEETTAAAMDLRNTQGDLSDAISRFADGGASGAGSGDRNAA